MELFYSKDITGDAVRLDEEESGHCVRVLRHRTGDEISVIDGQGTLMRCRIVSDRPKAVEAEVISRIEGWNGHPYRLTMAVCPTKNIDRYEWFAEKATEIAVDSIVPVIGEHSERRVVKTQRLEKIVLSAAKQSLKGAVPEVAEPLTVREFLLGGSGQASSGGRLADGQSSHDWAASLKLIACCFEDEEHPRRSIREALEQWLKTNYPNLTENKAEAYEENTLREGARAEGNVPEIIVLIGPEGDFSQEELQLAVSCGFIPVHLGPSRLRTETAALLCVEAAYSALAL